MGSTNLKCLLTPVLTADAIGYSCQTSLEEEGTPRVVVKNDDLPGDGVDAASRLEGITEPHSVRISSSIYDHIMVKRRADAVPFTERWGGWSCALALARAH